MKLRAALILFTLLPWTTFSFSQGGDGPEKGTFVSTHSGGIAVRSIPGVPFSADLVKEFAQKLPDGTLGRRESRGKIFRDAQGRTRVETEVISPEPGVEPRPHIAIFDPVQHWNIDLDPAAKTATILHFPGPPPSTGIHARGLSLLAAGNSPRNVVAGNLGTMEIEGFTATGSRSMRAIETGPADSGARRTILRESWFSPGLQIDLLSSTDDSKTGRRATRVVNIQRNEPDPALFQPPADYVVKDFSSQR